ncbi:MAG TPA: S-ribosylhomocysteine lyase [Pseudoclavibacter sp.]|nr:S-ribosylhomocysteine lyase [Pseudoclavibacter sp.]
MVHGEDNGPESFELDHTAVAAPFVRIASVKTLHSGGQLTKYDVRFCQPNVAHLDMPVVHSIEHSLATTLRWHSDDVIDISPMGCQTGFYVIVDGPTEYDAFLNLLEVAMRDVLTLDHTPAATPRQCGYAASHDIRGAQAAITDFLAHRDEWARVFSH